MHALRNHEGGKFTVLGYEKKKVTAREAVLTASQRDVIQGGSTRR